MTYVDGFVAAVPEGNKALYLEHAALMAPLFRKYGALRVVETWADDVPEGKLNSFHTAVLRKEGEVVVFSWVEWPDKATRDAGWAAMMADPIMAEQGDLAFDGQRLIYGGFGVILER